MESLGEPSIGERAAGSVPGPGPGITESDLGEFLGAGVLPYAVTDGGRVKLFLGKELSKGRTLTGES
jgi:hypothetical protein